MQYRMKGERMWTCLEDKEENELTECGEDGEVLVGCGRKHSIIYLSDQGVHWAVSC